MYARATTVQADPQRIDQGIGYIRDEVMPAVQSMPGCMGLSMLCDRDSGRCIVTTSWDSEETMSASREAVRAMREQATDVMGGQFEVQEWEIAVVHRAHAMGEGACAKVTYSRLRDAGQADRVIDALEEQHPPAPGGVRRLRQRQPHGGPVHRPGRGHRVLRQPPGDGADTGDGRRACGSEFSSRMDVEITDVLEMEVAIHHLRVPEMV